MMNKRERMRNKNTSNLYIKRLQI